MLEPQGLDDERFVYVVTAAGVEALREEEAAFDSEREDALIAEQRFENPAEPATSSARN